MIYAIKNIYRITNDYTHFELTTSGIETPGTQTVIIALTKQETRHDITLENNNSYPCNFHQDHHIGQDPNAFETFIPHARLTPNQKETLDTYYQNAITIEFYI